ncbi:MAG: serine--tRNA ligase, partial [Candidatus Taylorbacteria bacterium]|nr:serine--tRNA ligase [Candidatus Taylorbacteria bacterium]
MLDIRFIRENKDLVAMAAKKKHVQFNVDELIMLDDRRRILMATAESKRAEQNAANSGIASSISIEDRAKMIATMRTVKADLEKAETELKEVMKSWQDLMLRVPNIPDMSVPDGDSDAGNVEVKNWGSKPEFSFEAKDHIELMTSLGMVDFERAAKVHGFRGYYFT